MYFIFRNLENLPAFFVPSRPNQVFAGVSVNAVDQIAAKVEGAFSNKAQKLLDATANNTRCSVPLCSFPAPLCSFSPLGWRLCRLLVSQLKRGGPSDEAVLAGNMLQRMAQTYIRGDNNWLKRLAELCDT